MAPASRLESPRRAAGWDAGWDVDALADLLGLDVEVITKAAPVG